MHEPFDKELRGRLLKYTEEPDAGLWQGIARRIVSVSPEPGWVVWTTRLSSLLIVLSAVLFFADGEDPYPAAETRAVIPLASPKIDTDPVEVPSRAGHLPVPGGIAAKKSIPSLVERPDVKNTHDHVKLLPSARWEPESSLPEQENLTVTGKNESPVQPRVGSAVDSPIARADTATMQSSVDKSPRTALRAESAATGASEKADVRRSPLSLYFTAMPTFGYQRIESNNTDNIFIQGIERIPAFSTDRLGVRLEAGLEVPVSNRWKAFAGVLYYQRKQTIGYVVRQEEIVIIGSGQQADPASDPNLQYAFRYTYESRSIEHELKNAGVQFGVMYRLLKERENPMAGNGMRMLQRKLSHVFGSGLEFHKALNETPELRAAEGFRDPSAYVFFNLYYRMQYPEAGRLRAVFQPTFNYSFYINENLNAPFYVKPYGFGLNFGCTYNL